jgi:hypothetical protein
MLEKTTNQIATFEERLIDALFDSLLVKDSMGATGRGRECAND